MMTVGKTEMDGMSRAERQSETERTELAAPMAGTLRRTDADGAAVRKMEEVAGLIASLADMLRITNERMAAMERVIRTLEKVTKQQARQIGKTITDRAAEICGEYRMTVTDEKERILPDPLRARAVAAAIRKDVREATGCRYVCDIPRCDYTTVMDMVYAWEDYEVIREIRRRGA